MEWKWNVFETASWKIVSCPAHPHRISGKDEDAMRMFLNWRFSGTSQPVISSGCFGTRSPPYLLARWTIEFHLGRIEGSLEHRVQWLPLLYEKKGKLYNYVLISVSEKRLEKSLVSRIASCTRKSLVKGERFIWYVWRAETWQLWACKFSSKVLHEHTN